MFLENPMKYLNPYIDHPRFIDLGQCLVIDRRVIEVIVYDLYALADMTRPISIHDVNLGYRCSDIDSEYGSTDLSFGWKYRSDEPSSVVTKRFVEYLLDNNVKFPPIDEDLL